MTLSSLFLEPPDDPPPYLGIYCRGGRTFARRLLGVWRCATCGERVAVAW